VGAVEFLRNTLYIAATGTPEDFEESFKRLKPAAGLAEEMRGPMQYLQPTCGYRWEKIVLELCRAIGDEDYRAARPRAWHVGLCNGQLAFAYRDDPARVATTCAILAGMWAWLCKVPTDVVKATYPSLALVAERVRNDLKETTPVKRWLAGRLFVGIRIWLEEFDHGDIKQPRPAMEPYPTLSSP
jgi:hypothetical protein